MATATTKGAKEYVLQWTGHAAHVTERFSGLLARQALVDVTLICQGQKLRVHKLVLASSSLYFEEMLEEDLGQEPVILLRDLDFQVLKAMVEFMYCGETTISQCHLQTLLDAAQVFKVKELKCIVESMIKSTLNDKVLPDTEDPIIEVAQEEEKNNRIHPSGERCDEKCFSTDYEDAEEISEGKSDRVLDNNSQINENEDESSMYETSEEVKELSCEIPITESSDQGTDASLSTSDSESLKLFASEDDDSAERTSETCKISSEFTEDNNLRSIYNETYCCKFVDSETENQYEDLSTSSKDEEDLPRSVGECSKVYTHKKRKLTRNSESPKKMGESVEKMPKLCEKESRKKQSKVLRKNSKTYNHNSKTWVENNGKVFTDSIEELLSPSHDDLSITLGYDASWNNTQIDPATDFDMETSEYVWNLSAETIQYVVGCAINPSNSTITNEAKNPQDESAENRDTETPCDSDGTQERELFSCDDEENLDIFERPVLRRSVRRTQLEHDDSLNNNRTMNTGRAADKERDKEKLRRRVKDSNCRLIDENFVRAPDRPDKKENSRSLKSESKPSKRGKMSRVVTREENARSRHTREKSKRSADILVNTRLNTIASVDRSLWGDMSDILENCDDSSEDLLNYSSSREIPFAVGLLPLRAALERMQATLDHQPRKTRSSVAPWKQEMSQRRRTINDDSSLSRKTNNVENQNVERAICHIEIRTSSNQNETKNKIPTDEKIITVGTNGESDKQ